MGEGKINVFECEDGLTRGKNMKEWNVLSKMRLFVSLVLNRKVAHNFDSWLVTRS